MTSRRPSRLRPRAGAVKTPNTICGGTFGTAATTCGGSGRVRADAAWRLWTTSWSLRGRSVDASYRTFVLFVSRAGRPGSGARAAGPEVRRRRRPGRSGGGCGRAVRARAVRRRRSRSWSGRPVAREVGIRLRRDPGRISVAMDCCRDAGGPEAPRVGGDEHQRVVDATADTAEPPATSWTRRRPDVTHSRTPEGRAGAGADMRQQRGHERVVDCGSGASPTTQLGPGIGRVVVDARRPRTRASRPGSPDTPVPRPAAAPPGARHRRSTPGYANRRLSSRRPRSGGGTASNGGKSMMRDARGHPRVGVGASSRPRRGAPSRCPPRRTTASRRTASAARPAGRGPGPRCPSPVLPPRHAHSRSG